jgi:hypothetical protein
VFNLFLLLLGTLASFVAAGHVVFDDLVLGE